MKIKDLLTLLLYVFIFLFMACGAFMFMVEYARVFGKIL